MHNTDENILIHNTILGVVEFFNLIVILTYFYGQNIHLSKTLYFIIGLTSSCVIFSYLTLKFRKYIFYLFHFLTTLFNYSLFTFYLIVEKRDDNIVLTLFIINTICMASWIFIAYDITKSLFKKSGYFKPSYYKIIDNIEEDCCICYESKLSGNIIELECTHTFHEECINKWLINSENCPYCRMDIV